jgi:hypothetical protein
VSARRLTSPSRPNSAPAYHGEPDPGRIRDLVEEWMCENDVWCEELRAGRLDWRVDGFDNMGIATVTVTHKTTGHVVAWASVHWSSLVQPELIGGRGRVTRARTRSRGSHTRLIG